MMARPIPKPLAWAEQPSIGGPVRPAKSMLTGYKATRLHNSCPQSQPSRSECSFHATHGECNSILLVQVLMFPETDAISNIISDTVRVVFKRRLIDRVLRLWTEMARGQGFPRRDQIEPSKLGIRRSRLFGQLPGWNKLKAGSRLLV